jgi:hypothetical protein
VALYTREWEAGSGLLILQFSPSGIQSIDYSLGFVYFCGNGDEAWAIAGNGGVLQGRAFLAERLLRFGDAEFDSGVFTRFEIGPLLFC